ncbi:hypothetical protein [Stratiformator vulcanicus]|uniref:SH3b domain-containing protein n=1 Tax=Stratiformator vulcanicus TaxID=2527980 RepID=A0A517R5I6_9PLAN|nr:hypothetical protein [Stratiformator vulcanicus]QDT39166.1 hypothetical protein Pan189_35690 [Stratiformator vulcanicus]
MSVRVQILIAAAVLLSLSFGTAGAQVREFPYEAVVMSDGLPVRSGPGEDFYLTTKLQRGERVVVFRHDPGGWYMIVVPQGGFSLVPTDSVEPLRGGLAEITADNVSVRVGSYESDELDVEQIRLNRGARVRPYDLPVGVKLPEGYTAIVPPQGEYRWVPGQFLTPAADHVRDQQDRDPYAVPSATERPQSFAEVEELTDAAGLWQTAKAEIEPPVVTGEDGPEPSGHNVPAQVADAGNSATGGPAIGWDVIKDIDAAFETMTSEEPSKWDIESAREELTQLQAQAPAAIARAIAVRLAKVDRLEVVRNEYREYVKLTSATDRRDAALHDTQVKLAAGAISVEKVAEAETREAPRTSQVNRLPKPRHVTSTGSKSRGRQKSKASGKSRPRRFDAVGRIERSSGSDPQTPEFVLVGPDGKAVSYLKDQPGIDLERFIGKAMGVDGKRFSNPQFPIPMIAVERLTPVAMKSRSAQSK